MRTRRTRIQAVLGSSSTLATAWICFSRLFKANLFASDQVEFIALNYLFWLFDRPHY